MGIFDLFHESEKEAVREKLEKQYNRLGNHLGKSKPVIDDQTIHFWNLQLQFMEMDLRSLLSMYISIKDSGLYTVNFHTKKINDIMDNEARFWGGNKKAKPSEDDRLCLATHLALQLSGLA